MTDVIVVVGNDHDDRRMRGTASIKTYATGIALLCIMVLFGALLPQAKMLPKTRDELMLAPGIERPIAAIASSTPPLRQAEGPRFEGINPKEIVPGKPTVIPLDHATAQPDLFAQQQARFLAKASPEHPLTIYLFPLHMMTAVNNTRNFLVDELKHFVYDGIMKSPYLNVSWDVQDIAHHDLWMAQTLLGFAPSRWCNRFTRMVEAIKVKNRDQRPPIVLMNWQDSIDPFSCTTPPSSLTSLMGGTQRLFYTKRGIVRDRRYNFDTNEVENGFIDTFSNWSSMAGAPLRHTPYAVRSDFVLALEQVVYGNDTDVKPNSWLETDAVAGLERPKDVVQFWPLEGRGVDRGGGRGNSRLRDSVSRLLEQMAAPPSRLKIFAGLAGEANLIGRNSVDLSYARAILEYKIVVVAQKDPHEEHYRLMEAIVSGAMVMSDVMLSIPKDFVDGESIVFYRSMDDLKSKIEYFLKHEEERLAIARRGWTLAMHRHRSWHRMEELIFGKLLSPGIP